MAEPAHEPLRDENRRLKRENRELREENSRLSRQVDELQQENRQLQQDNRQLGQENQQLRNELEASQREAKRQAAPFSRNAPCPHPKKPGRKPGAAYGRKAHRPPPDPELIDEFYDVPLPAACPHCGGSVREEGVQRQYQVELPQRPIYRQFTVHTGHCECCGRAVRGRHKLMTSAAVGAAGSQIGPRGQAVVVYLNKRLGLSHAKIAMLFSNVFGIPLTRGGVTQIILRAGQKSEPMYEQIRRSVRGSPFIVPDETGWRIGGRPAWLHVIVGEHATCYVIAAGREGDVAAGVVGWEYSGSMIHDGYAAYGRFKKATHQQCLRHPLARCRRLLERAVGGAVRLPRAVMRIFQAALRARDRHAAGELSDHGLAVVRGRLRAELQRQVAPIKANADNERLAAHLERHLDEWFTFLTRPGVDATNWRGEQALRFAIVNRKVWGGNRTPAGARAQEVLTSVLTTCVQQSRDPITFLMAVLCGTAPQLLAAGGR